MVQGRHLCSNKEPGSFHVVTLPFVAINTSQDGSVPVPGRIEEEMKRENDILIMSYKEGSWKLPYDICVHNLLGRSESHGYT